MAFVAFGFLVATMVIGVMTIGATASGSAELLSQVFYLSAGLFFAFLIIDTVVRTRRSRQAQKEYAEKLEKAIRG